MNPEALTVAEIATALGTIRYLKATSGKLLQNEKSRNSIETARALVRLRLPIATTGGFFFCDSNARMVRPCGKTSRTYMSAILLFPENR